MANNSGVVKQETLYSTWLNIYGNVLLTPNICMQITNISHVFFGQLPRKKFPVWTLPLLFAGIVGMIIGSPDSYSDVSEMIFALGVIAAIITVIIIIAYAFSKPLFGLHIVMNSGVTYTFTSDSPDFIEKAHGVLCERFNRPGSETYMTLNFGTGTIVNNPKVAGNINT